MRVGPAYVVVAGLAHHLIERLERFETRWPRLGELVQHRRQPGIEADPVLVLAEIALLPQKPEPQRFQRKADLIKTLRVRQRGVPPRPQFIAVVTPLRVGEWPQG